ncbi:membrane-like protein, partial [Mesorhizobium sanjuanii]
MFESLIGLVAIIALFVIIARQQSRIGLIERELGALRSLVLSGAPVAPPQHKPVEPAANDSKPANAAAAVVADIVSLPKGKAAPKRSAKAKIGEVESGPWTTGKTPSAGAAPAEPAAATAKAAQKPDIETALGTRWAVWVGGIALALGGLFLIRYTIEAGIFGPGVRLSMAALLGLVLVGGGEFIRRTGFRLPVQDAAGAYIPAILTAAGAFILFGTVYAAHGVYGFIGPALAFTLLGAIGVATIAAALVHGQALAGIGLLGAMVTPMLIASQAPNPWALFGYLAIVLAATGVIARMRDWTFLMAAAFIGTGLWVVLFMTDAPGANLPVILFIDAVTLAVLAFVWLGRRGGETEPDRGFDWPSIAPGFFVGFSAMALFVDPVYAAASGALAGAALIAALVAVALYRPRALALLHAAGLVTVLVYLGIIPPTSVAADFSDSALGVGSQPALISDPLMLRIGIGLGLVFIGAGFWAARRFAATAWVRSASWAAWGVVAPLIVLLALWLTFGNLDRDLVYAAAAALLAAGFAAGGEWIARGEEPPLRGGAAVSFALGGAAVAG